MQEVVAFIKLGLRQPERLQPPKSVAVTQGNEGRSIARGLICSSAERLKCAGYMIGKYKT